MVVVLTALELEYQPLRRRLTGIRSVTHPAGTIFEIGAFADGAPEVALAVLGEGNQTAAVITDRSAALFRPELVLFVGVAGALHSDIALGDLVVATRVYSYHSGKETSDGFQARPRVWDAPHQLEQHARYISRIGAWRELLPRGRAAPTVHFKPIAAGEAVISAADSALSQVIRHHYNDAAAVDMEAAGVARAAHLNRAMPALVIRGISDHADADKAVADREGWQHAAAENAAAFALSLIASLPLDDRQSTTPADRR
jgi:5'-methylthioadenosine/S-adenosylhomocysteine nucleosidase